MKGLTLSFHILGQWAPLNTVNYIWGLGGGLVAKLYLTLCKPMN